jgi:hypothetical protein
MKPTNRELCLVMAMFQYKCRNERLMWQWLFEWVTWGEDMACFVDARMPVFKPRKAKRKWKNLSNAETNKIIQKLPNWQTDHLSTFIFKTLVEDKLKEKNR